MSERPPPSGAWSQLLLLLPSFLAVAWLVSHAQWFWRNQPDLQFGWVVLLLCVYLFWEAWEQRPQIQFRARWWALGVGLAAALFLLLIQSYWAVFGMHAATMMGLALGTLGLCVANVGMVFGWPGIRRFALAYGFILIAMPLPGLIHGMIVGGLQYKVAAINTEVLNLMGIPARQVGSLIHLPGGTVGIDEACSGIRSLQSTVMATIFIGYLTLRRVGLQVVLFVCGVGLAIVGNLIRSLFLSLEANAKGIDAVKEYHDAAGWSILAFTAVGVIILSWLLKKLERQADELAREADANPARSPLPDKATVE